MFLLKLDSWKAFSILMAPILLASMVDASNYYLKIGLSILAYFIIFGWYFIVGSSLNDNVPDKEYRSDILFKLNCFYLFAYLSTSLVINDSLGYDNLLVYLPSILKFYFVLAFIHVVYFSASSFLLNENNGANKLGERRVEITFLCFLIVFIGIWILQPKFKKIDF